MLLRKHLFDGDKGTSREVSNAEGRGSAGERTLDVKIINNYIVLMPISIPSAKLPKRNRGPQQHKSSVRAMCRL
ncbi:MAG: hypothetical protein ACOC4M_13720, partial [Promethearchaeia archaeon]